MADNRIRINTKGIEKLGKALADKYSIKVGIMGTKASKLHQDSDLTNAQIGMIHEFGSNKRNIPQRSFLRQPLMEHLPTYLSKKEEFKSKAIDEAIKEGTLFVLARKVGAVAEEVIQEAFATRGFGKWAKNSNITVNGGWIRTSSGKAFYVKGKGSDSPLIDTGQLRRSITSKVDKR